MAVLRFVIFLTASWPCRSLQSPAFDRLWRSGCRCSLLRVYLPGRAGSSGAVGRLKDATQRATAIAYANGQACGAYFAALFGVVAVAIWMRRSTFRFMKAGASIYSWVAAAILTLVFCISASTVFAHGAHHPWPASWQPASTMSSACTDQLDYPFARKAVVAAPAANVLGDSSDIHSRQAPCCTWSACASCYGALTFGVMRGVTVTSGALRRSPPGHDLRRRSFAAEAPPEPPRTFA